MQFKLVAEMNIRVSGTDVVQDQVLATVDR